MKDASSNSHRIVFYIRTPLRVIACITLWCFLFTIIPSEFLMERAWARTRVESPHTKAPNTLSIQALGLPAHLGEISDSWTAPLSDAKTVIHVQDAHCNYAAQRKIAEIIEYLNIEHGISTVNLEGGEGPYNLSLFTKIADTGERQKSAESFLKDGLINGAEYFAVNNPDSVALWGVEDADLYLKNLNTYRESLNDKDTIEKHLKSLSHILANLKRHIYTDELLEFDRKYVQHKTENLKFKDYLVYLSDKARQKGVGVQSSPNVALLCQSLKQEREINFKLANTERDQLIDIFQGALSRLELEDLVRNTVEFKKDRMPQKDFYAYLTRKARSLNINLGKFPELQKYIAYIATHEAVDKSKISGEIATLEDAIRETLYRNDNERDLDRLSKNLIITKSLFSITITADDYGYYKKNEDSFAVHNFTAFIERHAPLYKISAQLGDGIANLDLYRENIAGFYEYSFRRDEAFLKNLKSDNRVAILVTGGFHSENLHRLFKEKNISYVSIMPTFKNGQNCENPYFALLAGNSYAEFIKAAKSHGLYGLAIASNLNGLGKQAAESQPATQLEFTELSAVGAQAPVVSLEHLGEEVMPPLEFEIEYLRGEGRPVRLFDKFSNMKRGISDVLAANIGEGAPKLEELITNCIDAIWERLDAEYERLDEYEQYMFEGSGSIVLRLFRDDQRGTFSVVLSNNGHGIRHSLMEDWVNGRFVTTKGEWRNPTEGPMFFGGRGVGLHTFLSLARNKYAVTFVSRRQGEDIGYAFTQRIDGTREELKEATKNDTGTDVIITVPASKQAATPFEAFFGLSAFIPVFLTLYTEGASLGLLPFMALGLTPLLLTFFFHELFHYVAAKEAGAKNVRLGYLDPLHPLAVRFDFVKGTPEAWKKMAGIAIAPYTFHAAIAVIAEAGARLLVAGHPAFSLFLSAYAIYNLAMLALLPISVDGRLFFKALFSAKYKEEIQEEVDSSDWEAEEEESVASFSISEEGEVEYYDEVTLDGSRMLGISIGGFILFGPTENKNFRIVTPALTSCTGVAVRVEDEGGNYHYGLGHIFIPGRSVASLKGDSQGTPLSLSDHIWRIHKSLTREHGFNPENIRYTITYRPTSYKSGESQELYVKSDPRFTGAKFVFSSRSGFMEDEYVEVNSNGVVIRRSQEMLDEAEAMNLPGVQVPWELKAKFRFGFGLTKFFALSLALIGSVSVLIQNAGAAVVTNAAPSTAETLPQAAGTPWGLIAGVAIAVLVVAGLVFASIAEHKYPWLIQRDYPKEQVKIDREAARDMALQGWVEEAEKIGVITKNLVGYTQLIPDEDRCIIFYADDETRDIVPADRYAVLAAIKDHMEAAEARALRAEESAVVSWPLSKRSDGSYHEEKTVRGTRVLDISQDGFLMFGPTSATNFRIVTPALTSCTGVSVCAKDKNGNFYYGLAHIFVPEEERNASLAEHVRRLRSKLVEEYGGFPEDSVQCIISYDPKYYGGGSDAEDELIAADDMDDFRFRFLPRSGGRHTYISVSLRSVTVREFDEVVDEVDAVSTGPGMAYSWDKTTIKDAEPERNALELKEALPWIIAVGVGVLLGVTLLFVHKPSSPVPLAPRKPDVQQVEKKNIYRFNPADEGSAKKLERRFIALQKSDRKEHKPFSGMAGFDGSTVMREGVVASISGGDVHAEMFISGVFNGLSEGGKFAREGDIHIVPSGERTEKVTRVTISLPSMKQGEGLQVFNIFSGEIEPDDFVGGRLSLDKSGKLTANKNTEPTDITYAIRRRTKNGKVETSYPFSEWLAKEFRDIPDDIKRELNLVKTASDKEKQNAVAKIIKKHFVYSASQDVLLNRATWGAFLTDVLKEHKQFRTDCDVLSMYAFIFSRYIGLNVVCAVGYNNDGNSYLSEDEAHGVLLVENNGEWAIFDPSASAALPKREMLQPGLAQDPAKASIAILAVNLLLNRVAETSDDKAIKAALELQKTLPKPKTLCSNLLIALYKIIQENGELAQESTIDILSGFVIGKSFTYEDSVRSLYILEEIAIVRPDLIGKVKEELQAILNIEGLHRFAQRRIELALEDLGQKWPTQEEFDRFDELYIYDAKEGVAAPKKSSPGERDLYIARELIRMYADWMSDSITESPGRNVEYAEKLKTIARNLPELTGKIVTELEWNLNTRNYMHPRTRVIVRQTLKDVKNIKKDQETPARPDAGFSSADMTFVAGSFWVSFLAGMLFGMLAAPWSSIVSGIVLGGLVISLAAYRLMRKRPLKHEGFGHDEFYYWLDKSIKAGKIPAGLPLILFDTHTDSGLADRSAGHETGITRANWVFKARESGLIGDVYLVCNRLRGVPVTAQARDDLLEQTKYTRILFDVEELSPEFFEGPAILSVDFDYFSCHKPIIAASREKIAERISYTFGYLQENNIRLAAVGFSTTGTDYVYEEDLELISDELDNAYEGFISKRSRYLDFEQIATVAGAAGIVLVIAGFVIRAAFNASLASTLLPAAILALTLFIMSFPLAYGLYYLKNDALKSQVKGMLSLLIAVATFFTGFFQADRIAPDWGSEPEPESGEEEIYVFPEHYSEGDVELALKYLAYKEVDKAELESLSNRVIEMFYGERYAEQLKTKTTEERWGIIPKLDPGPARDIRGILTLCDRYNMDISDIDSTLDELARVVLGENHQNLVRAKTHEKREQIIRSIVEVIKYRFLAAQQSEKLKNEFVKKGSRNKGTDALLLSDVISPSMFSCVRRTEKVRGRMEGQRWIRGTSLYFTENHPANVYKGKRSRAQQREVEGFQVINSQSRSCTIKVLLEKTETLTEKPLGFYNPSIVSDPDLNEWEINYFPRIIGGQIFWTYKLEIWKEKLRGAATNIVPEVKAPTTVPVETNQPPRLEPQKFRDIKTDAKGRRKLVRMMRPTSRGKGVLPYFIADVIFWGMGKFGIEITKERENFIEDRVVSWLEELFMAGAALTIGMGLKSSFAGALSYIGIRLIFTLLHAFKDRAPPSARDRFYYYRRLVLPALISAVSLLPLPLAAIMPLPVALGVSFVIGGYVHMRANLYVSDHRTSLKKAVLGIGLGEIERPLESIPEEEIKNIFVYGAYDRLFPPKLGETVVNLWPLVTALHNKYPKAILYVATDFPGIFQAQQFKGKIKPIPLHEYSIEEWGYEPGEWENFTIKKMANHGGMPNNQYARTIRSSFLSAKKIDMVFDVAPVPLNFSHISAKDFPEGEAPHMFGLESITSRVSARTPECNWNPDCEYSDREGNRYKVMGFQNAKSRVTPDNWLPASGIWLLAMEMYNSLGLDLNRDNLTTLELGTEESVGALTLLRDWFYSTNPDMPTDSYDPTKKIIVINVYAQTHHLEREYWVRMILSLINNTKDAYFVFTHGGEMDRDYEFVEEVVEKVRRQMGIAEERNGNELVLPKVSIYPFINDILGITSAVVTLDTGLSHVASGEYGILSAIGSCKSQPESKFDTLNRQNLAELVANENIPASVFASALEAGLDISHWLPPRDNVITVDCLGGQWYSMTEQDKLEYLDKRMAEFADMVNRAPERPAAVRAKTAGASIRERARLDRELVKNPLAYPEAEKDLRKHLENYIHLLGLERYFLDLGVDRTELIPQIIFVDSAAQLGIGIPRFKAKLYTTDKPETFLLVDKSTLEGVIVDDYEEVAQVREGIKQTAIIHEVFGHTAVRRMFPEFAKMHRKALAHGARTGVLRAKTQEEVLARLMTFFAIYKMSMIDPDMVSDSAKESVREAGIDISVLDINAWIDATIKSIQRIGDRDDLSAFRYKGVLSKKRAANKIKKVILKKYLFEVKKLFGLLGEDEDSASPGAPLSLDTITTRFWSSIPVIGNFVALNLAKLHERLHLLADRGRGNFAIYRNLEGEITHAEYVAGEEYFKHPAFTALAAPLGEILITALSYTFVAGLMALLSADVTAILIACLTITPVAILPAIDGIIN
ncbi:hypothetical protein ACFL3J_02220, partial [Candidatus Omnitrophota bacterium]